MKTITRAKAFILVLTLCLGLSACFDNGGGGGDDDTGDGGTINGYNVNLASLEVSDGVLSPVFKQATTCYTVEVAEGVNSIDVTAAAVDDSNTLTIDGNDYTGTTTVEVSVGMNIINIKVTAEDELTDKTYSIVVNRLDGISKNPNLADLSLSDGTLSPAFYRHTESYTAEVDYNTFDITVTPLAAGVGATVTVNGETLPNGTESAPISLAVGLNYIDVEVTADDGTTRMYTVEVKRLVMEPSHNATLADLSISDGELDPGFNGEMYTSYTAKVPYTTSTFTVTPIVAGVDATVTVNGSDVPSGTASGEISLDVGVNVIDVIVTAADGMTSKTYTVEVTRYENEYIESYPVIAGKTVNEGDIVRLVNGEVETASTSINTYGESVLFTENDNENRFSIVPLTKNKTIVAYSNYSGSGYGYAQTRLMIINENDITVLDPVTISDCETGFVFFAALSENRVIVIYQDFSTRKTYARILTVNGADISPGAVTEISSRSDFRMVETKALTSNKVLITYYLSYESPDQNETCILSIEGETITVHSPTVLTNEYVSKFGKVAVLSANKILLTYYIPEDLEADPDSAYGVLLNINDDNTIIEGAHLEIDRTTYIRNIYPVALTPDRAIASYRRLDVATGKDETVAVVLDVTGEATINPGPISTVEADSYFDESTITALTSDTVVTTYSSSSNYGAACTLIHIHDDSTISIGDSTVVTGFTNFPKTTALSSTKAIISYRDYDNDYRSSARVVDFSDTGSIIGIAKETRSDGELCQVAIFDQSQYIYDLDITTGDTYYWNSSGDLSTEQRNIPPHPGFEWFDPIINFKVGTAVTDSIIDVIGVYE